MYLKRATILNVGPISDLEFLPPFNEDGTPQPVVFVGTNGSGKTGLLSILADGLLEIANSEFEDILPRSGIGHKYFRIVGGSTIRSGSVFELSGLLFEDGENRF